MDRGRFLRFCGFIGFGVDFPILLMFPFGCGFLWFRWFLGFGVDFCGSDDFGTLAWIFIIIMIWWIGVDFCDSADFCDLVWILKSWHGLFVIWRRFCSIFNWSGIHFDNLAQILMVRCGFWHFLVCCDLVLVLIHFWWFGIDLSGGTADAEGRPRKGNCAQGGPAYEIFRIEARGIWTHLYGCLHV